MEEFNLECPFGDLPSLSGVWTERQINSTNHKTNTDHDTTHTTTDTHKIVHSTLNFSSSDININLNAHNFSSNTITDKIYFPPPSNNSCSTSSNKKEKSNISFISLNCQSIKNKVCLVLDYLYENHIDVALLQETWLHDEDLSIYYKFKEYGYKYQSHNREHRRGGGVAVLLRPNIQTRPNPIKTKQQFNTFEYIFSSIKIGKTFINLVNLYRPPYSPIHPFTIKNFLDEFNELLSFLLEINGHLMLVGDLNINCLDLTNQYTLDLLAVLKTYDLYQLISSPTHIHGSLIDVIIVDKNIFSMDIKTKTCYDFKTDHYPVKLIMEEIRTRPEIIQKQVRNLTLFDQDQFIEHLKSSNLCNPKIYLTMSPSDCVDLYNSSLSSIYNKLCPIATKRYRIDCKRPVWYNQNLQKLKQQKRKAERKFKKLPSLYFKNIFDKAKNIYKTKLEERRSEFYNERIRGCTNDSKNLFKTLRKITGSEKTRITPQFDKDEVVTEKLADYYINKIDCIRQNIEAGSERKAQNPSTKFLSTNSFQINNSSCSTSDRNQSMSICNSIEHSNLFNIVDKTGNPIGKNPSNPSYHLTYQNKFSSDSNLCSSHFSDHYQQNHLNQTQNDHSPYLHNQISDNPSCNHSSNQTPNNYSYNNSPNYFNQTQNHLSNHNHSSNQTPNNHSYNNSSNYFNQIQNHLYNQPQNHNYADANFEFTEVTNEELKLILKSIKRKTCDLDPIPTTILVTVFNELLPFLLHLINQSILTSTFPDNLKTATVSPVIKNKKEDINTLSNYRPVSNLPFLSKVFELFLYYQLDYFLENYKLHSTYQSAYRQHNSCETAMVWEVDIIQQNMFNKNCVALLILDSSCAFDTVDHTILLDKLKTNFHIGTHALNLIKSFLNNRNFSVKINNTNSKTRPLKYGVIQGSLLGPLMYILYTKDIELIAKKHGLQIMSYADDVQLFISFKIEEIDHVKQTLTNCLKDVINWTNMNFLKLNTNKTQLKLFNPTSSPLTFQLKLDGQTIELVDEIKILGVIIKNNLNFQSFISKKVRSCNFKLRNLWHIRRSLPVQTRITLITNMILSDLDYCNSTLACATAKLIQPLQKILNRSARFIFNINPFSHISPYLKRLHFLPITYRIKFKTSLLCFKIFNKMAPDYLLDNFPRFEHNTRINLRTETGRGRDNYMFAIQLPPHKKETLFYKMKAEWNQLPLKIRKTKLEDINIFKKNLKTHYFKQAFPEEAI